jgi:hypothetical protein
MGKRKWKRVRLADLASEATQKEILGLIDRANGPQGPPGGGCQDCEPSTCGKEAPETATTGR